MIGERIYYMNYKSVEPKNLHENIFDLIGDKWMLVTAAKPDKKINTMTASWGGMGIMWGKPVASCVIRPVRYTYEFMEESNYFTLAFFPEEYRNALNILGTKSGRDGDKIKESGLTPAVIKIDNSEVFSFEEANITMICRKLYYHDVNPANFIDPDLDKNYPKKDYHRMYFGEIVNCFVQE